MGWSREYEGRPILSTLLDQEIQRRSIVPLMGKAGMSDQIHRYFQTLREGYKRKRKFIQILNDSF